MAGTGTALLVSCLGCQETGVLGQWGRTARAGTWGRGWGGEGEEWKRSGPTCKRQTAASLHPVPPSMPQCLPVCTSAWQYPPVHPSPLQCSPITMSLRCLPVCHSASQFPPAHPSLLSSPITVSLVIPQSLPVCQSSLQFPPVCPNLVLGSPVTAVSAQCLPLSSSASQSLASCCFMPCVAPSS